MKCLATILIALNLIACGTNGMSDSEKKAALNDSETAEELPNLRGWQIMADATESCTQTSADDMSCAIEFTAGSSNCGDATFKLIVKSHGYEYIQTLEHVIIRQGEFHQLKFDSKPQVFNIADEFAEEMYHAVRCYGSDGEIVAL